MCGWTTEIEHPKRHHKTQNLYHNELQTHRLNPTSFSHIYSIATKLILGADQQPLLIVVYRVKAKMTGYNCKLFHTSVGFVATSQQWPQLKLLQHVIPLYLHTALFTCLEIGCVLKESKLFWMTCSNTPFHQSSCWLSATSWEPISCWHCFYSDVFWKEKHWESVAICGHVNCWQGNLNRGDVLDIDWHDLEKIARKSYRTKTSRDLGDGSCMHSWAFLGF